MNVLDLITSQKLLICVGAGGVGKTSLAAAMGVRAAKEGRKVLVLTIDPAKRLANSLGLKQFGNDETQIDLSTLGDVDGELWAMMLDGKHAFNELIERVAKDEETKKNIYSNNIYQSIADTIVGNQEYMATEKLYDVIVSKRYDLVILDTPPVKNALDFLESPGRMARFVDKRIMQWFLKPYDEKRIFGRLIAGTSAALFRLLSYIFGKDFIKDITIFFQNFRDLYEGFQERHRAVENMFRDDQTSFLVICAPNEASVDVADFFIDELGKRNMPNPGVIVNQCHLTSNSELDVSDILKEVTVQVSTDLPVNTSTVLLARISSAYRRLKMLSNHENSLIESLSNKKDNIWIIPRIHGEVHDIYTLNTVGNFLCNGSKK
jgi:anion-transporting  ArsA/GET3 family ATPase